MTFQENIQNWVALDNKIKKLNSETRALREQKNIITTLWTHFQV